MSGVLFVAIAILHLTHSIYGQSNYADQANSVDFQGDGLPDQATLDGKVTKLDDLSPVIFLNRTKAALNCAAGSMQVELKFNEKYHGKAYADFDRNSACQIYGNGGYSYKIELPLKGCGTKQGPQRVFTNNIVVRFHPTLEIDGDEIITIVCRYPPPVAPVPPPLIDYRKEEPTPGAALGPPLKSFQILLIVCGILFLSLLLLGLGCSYYCLRRRNVAVIRRHPFSSIGSDSEITKLSGSSLGNLSMIEGLRIPRAHAPLQAAASSSGSDGPLISDTLPSDYPSESHSEIEELDARSLPVSSAGSFENKAFVQDTSSIYSEGYGHTQEKQIQNAIATTSMVPRLPLAAKDQPKFDVQVRVNRTPPAPASLSISDTDSSISRAERNLTTILEQHEGSVRSMDSPRMEKLQFTYLPELHHVPKHIQPAPTYNRILKRQQELQESSWEEPRISSARSLASLNTEMTDTHSVTEMIDDSHHRMHVPVPPPPPPIIPREVYVVNMERPSFIEPLPIYKPEITSHMVDDVYLRTITEKKTIEDIERHKRSITEYHTRPIEEQKWDVTIKNYPMEMPEPPDWENFSDISSASGLTITSIPERFTTLQPTNTIDDNKLPLNSPELVGNIGHSPRHESFLSPFDLPMENPRVPNWNVLIRVFQPNEMEGPVIENAETFNSQLTVADKIKWRQIITTESTLRTLLTEAIVREDFERIRHDTRYVTLFEPPKWDVIIRILSPNDKQKNRYKKKADWDTRSRRSSLPTLYEYDSDGGSSVRTLIREPVEYPPVRSRRTSRSSYRSEADLRSMSEMIVDFGRPDHHDAHSESSNYYTVRSRFDDDSEPEIDYKTGNSRHQLARSLSQPSLARSASEFTEHWIAPSRYDTTSEFTSPEGTPKSQRSTRMYPLQYPPRGAADHSSMWQARASSQATHHIPGVTSQMVTREVKTETSGRFVASRSQDWFGDNDSETNFK